MRIRFGRSRRAPFAVTAFTKSEVNGDYISFQSPTQYSLKYGNVLRIRASLLMDGGDSFKLTFVHS